MFPLNLRAQFYIQEQSTSLLENVVRTEYTSTLPERFPVKKSYSSLQAPRSKYGSYEGKYSISGVTQTINISITEISSCRVLCVNL